MKLLETLSTSESSLVKTGKYAKGEIIAREGDICSGIFIVNEGTIRILSYALSGNEIVYNELGPGMMFGNNLVFSSDPVYKGNVVALSDAKLSFISDKDVLTLIRANESFAIEYLRFQSDFGKMLNAKIKMLSFDAAEDRLYFHLQSHGGEIVYPSVSSLAKELNLQRETLSRLIHRLAKQGKIKLNKNAMSLSL